MSTYEEMEQIACNEFHFGTDEDRLKHLDLMLELKPYDANILIMKGDMLYTFKKY